MKIVGTDNLFRETVADFLWLDAVPEKCKDFAQRVCDRLNKNLLVDEGGTFYCLKPDDYRLSRGMEDLV